MAQDLSKRPPHFAKKYEEFWRSERAAAWLYRALADIADENDAKTLNELANAEDLHASHWENLLRRSGVTDLTFDKAPLRERVLARLARRFGIERVLPTLVRLEAADAGKYLDVTEAPTSMSEEEVQHGRALALMGNHAPSRIADIESRHRVSSGGALRAATFGISDGLVSNLSLVMGVSGGTSNNSIVLLAGVAGLFAGAFSMAMGEWVSVKSQRELYEREIEIEREELIAFPDEERDELALIYRSKGLDPASAANLAERIMQRPAAALDTLVREELGLDPNDLVSPWVAAGASFFSFGVGAFLPIVPFMLTSGKAATLLSASMAGLGLVGIGMAISLLTGRGGLRSAMRMLILGAAAAGATYGVGRLIGLSIS